MGRRRDQAQFNMRLGRPLLKRLQNAARDQDRSVNSEMVYRLEQSFAQATSHVTDDARRRALLEMADAWLALAANRLQSDDLLTGDLASRDPQARSLFGSPRTRNIPGNEEPELPIPRAPTRTITGG
jgi:hypothetical protein